MMTMRWLLLVSIVKYRNFFKTEGITIDTSSGSSGGSSSEEGHDDTRPE